MKYVLVLIHIALIFVSVSISQTPAKNKPVKTSIPVKCEQTIVNLPKIRGLKLGITFDEVKKVYEKIRKEDLEQSSSLTEGNAVDEGDIFDGLFIEKKDIPKEHEENVKSISLGFVGGNLVYFMIDYDNSVEWKSQSEFIQRINETLGFSKNDWKMSSVLEDSAVATCGNYEAIVQFTGFSTSEIPVSLTIRRTKQSLIKEIADERIKKQKTFKP
jgi:hypothetical protein